MAARAFGQRGLQPRAASVVARAAPRSVAAAVVTTPEASASATEEDAPYKPDESGEVTRLFALFPLLTIAMILGLTVIFLLEKKFAPDVRGNELGLGSIVALGGASYQLVFGQGEWQRLFLAPVFHGSASHLIGNCVALGAIGLRLEPLVGRWWMCAIFVLSAAGGIVGSMIGNPPEVTTVGASGAITGLIGALFAMSFHNRADPVSSAKMRKTALFFGIPALAPLLWGASGNTDYHAHLGGALVGFVLGGVIGLVWDGASFRPGLEKVAAGVTFVFISMVGVSAAMAATKFKGHADSFSHLIPTSQTPDGLDVGIARADQLVARYPRDPRSHLFRAFALMKSDKLLAAEQELNQAVANAHELPKGRERMEPLVNGTLALIYSYQGRRGEAQAKAAPLCAGKLDGGMRRALTSARLCK